MVAVVAAVAAILPIAALPASAQPAGSGQPDVKAKIVAPAKVAAGTKTVVAVEMALGPKWHVNSHVPTEKFLIPTDVSLSAAPGSVSAVRYPKDVERRLAFSDKPLKVYEGTVRFEAELEVPAQATGRVILSGTLSYQACNDQQCFAPAKVPLSAEVTVQPGAK
jgi:hypothetical protein